MTYVDLETADKLLPNVTRKIKNLQRINEVLTVMESVEIEVDNPTHDELKFVTKFNKSLHKLSYNFYHKLEQLEKLGCAVEDLEEGVVTFRSKLAGRDILLSWQIGEEGVKYWHEMDECFFDRKKIVELLL